jgi:hypothetical protein
MKKIALALLALALSVCFAQAHALYIIVNGEKVQVIFSDDLKPDEKIKAETWKKVGTPVLFAKPSFGPSVSFYTTKAGENSMVATIDKSARMISGTTEYGVSKHGDKPKNLIFYYKYVNGANGDDAKHHEKCELEVIPIVADGKVKFQVLALGKHVAKSDVEIIVPGKDEKVKVTTDEKGFTKEFDTKGVYGVTARKSETKSGEYKGEKYEEVGFTATLVTELK